MEFRNIIRNILLKGDNLVDLLSTAFYGSPWFAVDREDKFNHLIKPTSECIEEKLADILKGGGQIKVIDWEEDKEYNITLEDIVKGIEKLHDTKANVYARVISFDGDADFYDADAVIQFAIFGEWVYG